jgi:hypothetical protein
MASAGTPPEQAQEPSAIRVLHPAAYGHGCLSRGGPRQCPAEPVDGR